MSAEVQCDAFTALKTGTQDIHRSLEERVPLLDPHLRLSTYLSFLQAMWGIYTPMEKQLRREMESAKGLGPEDMDRRYKSQWLRSDLSTLGQRSDEIDRLPLTSFLPQVDTPARLWGCLYVLEGSTLGGRVLTRHVCQTLAVSPESGARFLASYGPEVGGMWNCFQTALRARVSSPESIAEATASARATFTAFYDWMLVHFPDSPAGHE